MIKGLKRWAAGGILLREVRGLRLEAAGIKEGLTRIAEALELANAAQGFVLQETQPGDPGVPRVEITYADDAVTQEFAAIEADLVRATGRLPDEAQVFQEFERRHGLTPQEGGPLGLRRSPPAEPS